MVGVTNAVVAEKRPWPGLRQGYSRHIQPFLSHTPSCGRQSLQSVGKQTNLEQNKHENSNELNYTKLYSRLINYGTPMVGLA